MSKEFSVNQWIDAYDGIGQVESISDFFVEEYCLEYLQGMELGTPIKTIVVYKLLCNYEGKVAKRNLVRDCNASLCSVISDSSQKLVEKIKKHSPEEYEKYSQYKLQKPLKHKITSWLNVPEADVNNLNLLINTIAESFEGGFTFRDLLNKIQGEYPHLDLSIRDNVRPRNNLVLSLDNDNFLVDGKRAVFTSVKASINN